MEKFNLEIITPQRVAFTEEVQAVYAPTSRGTIGVLAHHMNLFTALTEGEVKIVTPSREYFLAIGGGFMEVARDKVSILVSRAVHAHEINENEIEQARKAAKEVITRQKKGAEYEEAQAVLRRSILEFRVLRHRKNQKLSA